jgi:DHA1 family bicyclomycin/chloramphenicol resistance-like MFS transporter
LRINRESFLFTAILGALSALPPLGIDMGLPGIPAIEAAFADAAGRGPLTISVFLVGFAISPLICGPLADRYGRRLTALVGLALFTAGAAGSAIAPSFNILLVARVIEGLAAGACMILPIAIVRDLFEGAAGRQRISQVVAVLSIGPIVAPIIGGWIMSFSSWRTIYAVQALGGLLLVLMIAMCFEESLSPDHRRSVVPKQLIASYRMVLSDAIFRGYGLMYAFGFGGLFCFVAGSPAVLMGGLGLSERTFSTLYGITAAGLLLGSLLSGRCAARHVPARKILNVGLTIMCAASFGGLALAVTGTVQAITIMPLMALVMFSFGLIAPSTNHAALQGLPHVAGAASGMLRCVQMVMGAVASALIAVLQAMGHPALVMTSVMSAMMLVSGLLFLRLTRLEASIPATT